MKYAPIDPQLFIDNRRRLAARLKPNSIAIVHAADVLPRSADGVIPFIQNSDLFYLTGVDQEETILLLYPDAAEPKYREVLFLRETNEQVRTWEGDKLTKEQARQATGIQTVLWTQEWAQQLRTLALQAECICLPLNEHPRAVIELETRETRFVRQCREMFPLHRYERLAPLLYELRCVKSDTELSLIRQAIDATDAGFRRLLGFIRPGVWEYEIEAELAHEWLRRRSRGFAYPPIIASGENACVLHYVANDRQCQDGDLVLLDVAAEYANYNSDLTRTVPVNGKFTPRQRQVYDAVLRVLRECFQLLQPGVLLRDYQKKVEKLMEQELIRLNLLDAAEVAKQDPEKPLLKKYFPHGTSHHLGLDVHDVAPPNFALRPGMVLTVEPGIYIREEQLGVRLENDVLITEDGVVDLMAHIPIEASDIEALMNG
ncbi:MAG: aminopeptidase P family protein [Verrucomicrobiales bacterium]|nr:aminopeptidase P family protein [Verrucomicrobiales bacterium]